MTNSAATVFGNLTADACVVAIVKLPNRLAALLQDERASQREPQTDDDDDVHDEASATTRTSYSAAELLPAEVVEMILRPQFEDCTTFKENIRTMTQLASVCRAWKPVAEAAAAPAGLLKYLPLVQQLDLVENRDLSALYSQVVEIARSASLDGTAIGEPAVPTRKQVKMMATILAECEGLLTLNAREYTDTVMQLLVTRFRFAELWPRLRSIRISWQFPLSNFYQMLVQISHIDTLESIYLYVVPKYQDSEPAMLARSQKLFAGLCEKLVKRCSEIDVLAFSWMRASADLSKILLPQLQMLGAIRIRKLTLTVRPMWALIDAGERVIALLNSLPPTIETVDALTISSNRVTAFARDYRLNIVYLHAEGLTPPYTALGRFCKTEDPNGELGVWHGVDTGETLDLTNRPAEEITPESFTGAMWAN